LAHWLSFDPDQVEFKSNDDVAFGVALLVAGKRWRALGGNANLGSEPGALHRWTWSAAGGSDESWTRRHWCGKP
jgi:hypothetical protein